MLRLRQLSLAALIALPLMACGGGGSSVAPENVQISGDWRFTFGAMTGVQPGGTVTCAVPTMDFAIVQTGSSFSGTQVGFTVLS